MTDRRQLIIDGSFCEGDAMEDQAVVAGSLFSGGDDGQGCRFFPAECPALHPELGPLCIPKTGQEVARFTVRLGTSVAQELRDFAEAAPMPPRGYFDPTESNPDESIVDREEVVARVGQWANKILGIHPNEAATVNREFSAPPDSKLAERFPVLNDSVYDETTSHWMHKCGTLLAFVEVIHPIRLRNMPMAGRGQVETVCTPFCPHCQKEPNQSGVPVFEDEVDVDRNEAEILRRMRENRE